MPTKNFEGDTFVAFTDLSGFKNLMKEGTASSVLNAFYGIAPEWDMFYQAAYYNPYAKFRRR